MKISDPKIPDHKEAIQLKRHSVKSCKNNQSGSFSDVKFQYYCGLVLFLFLFGGKCLI